VKNQSAEVTDVITTKIKLVEINNSPAFHLCLPQVVDDTLFQATA